MTAPRIPLFQRKGAPPASTPVGRPMPKASVVIAIGHGQPAPAGSAQDNAKDPKGGGEGMMDAPVTCPNCGCEFKPETGEIVSGDNDGNGGDQGPAGDGTDLGAKLKAMMGGGGPMSPDSSAMTGGQ